MGKKAIISGVIIRQVNSFFSNSMILLLTFFFVTFKIENCLTLLYFRSVSFSNHY
jgi:hypothetical protein